MGYKASPALRRMATLVPPNAGEVNERLITVTFDTAAVLATDIIEIAALPGRQKILAVSLQTEGFGAETTKAGFLSGTFRDADDARTLGSEFFAAQAANTEGNVGLAAVAALQNTDLEPKGIGVQFSAGFAAAGTRKVHLRIRYTSIV